METTFWLERWEQDSIGFHLERVNPNLLAHFGQLGLADGAVVLVPLCGKSLDLGWLASQGYRVIGVEVSRIAIEALFDEAGLAYRARGVGKAEMFEGGGLKILHADFFDLGQEHVEPDGPLGAVYDRAALVALPPALRLRYARHLLTLGAAPMLLVTVAYDQAQMSGPPFAVTDAEVEALFGKTHRIERLDAREIIEAEPRFRSRGVTSMVESVFHLRPRVAGGKSHGREKE